MIVAIINVKGGVGKTTTAVNLAVSLAGLGKTTLLVDCDPQAHATRCVVDPGSIERTVADLIMHTPSQAHRSVYESRYMNLSIVPASNQLTHEAEVLSTRIRREERLSKALVALDEHEYVILDSAPTEGILTHNVISAANLLLIPIQTGAGSIEGVDPLLSVAAELHNAARVNYRLFVTMFDGRSTVTNATILAKIKEHKPNLMRTVIAKSERINQANLQSKPIADYAPGSRGDIAYDTFARELIKIATSVS